MASQSFENSVVQTEAESRLRGSAALSVLRQNIVVFLNIALISARMLFSAVLLDSVINWNDHQWTTLHVLALIPFCWTTLTIILAIAGQFRWKVGGRIMTAADIMVSAAAIIFFPAYALSAIALAILSLAFLVLRHDGRFATLLSTLPLAAMLVRPLGGLEFLHYDWPIIYVSTGMAGEFVAFVISSLATFFSILIIVHIRIIEQPLTFQQPWEEEFSVGLGKHNIQPIMNLIRRIYPSSRLICILDRPNRKQSEEIIICSPISQLDVQPLRLHLINYSDHGHDPTIMALDDGFQVDVESGQQSTIPATFDKMVRELTRLGFQDGVLFDFKLADIRGRLFFSTGTPVEEAFRNDMVTLKETLGHFFDSATTWDTQRKKMMGFARDSARRDLHDGILQSLAALKMRLITILAKPSLTSYPELENLRKTVDIITVEQSRLRALLHNDEHEGHSINLVESIEVCLKTLSIQWDVSVSLVSLESALSVDRESADNIEYLAREMIANAIRHSDVQKLIFMMALNKGNLMIALKADLYVSGNSIDIKKAANQILASRSLMQRLAIVNGHAYSQDLEESTLLAISVPLEFTEND